MKKISNKVNKSPRLDFKTWLYLYITKVVKVGLIPIEEVESKRRMYVKDSKKNEVYIFKDYDEYKKFCLSPDYITAIRIFQETPNYYLYWIVESGQDRLCVHDKNNQESTICELAPYSGQYFISFGDIIDITQNHIITSIEASEMSEYLKDYNEYVNFEKDYPEQIQRMRKELPDIKDNDNPCIVIYSL